MADYPRDSSDEALANDLANGLMAAEDKTKLDSYPDSSATLVTQSQLAEAIAGVVAGVFPKTIIPSGTTGDVTINTPAGSVNFASGETQLVVTSSICTPNTFGFPAARTVDPSGVVDSITCLNGFFVISLSAPPTNEFPVAFLLI